MKKVYGTSKLILVLSNKKKELWEFLSEMEEISKLTRFFEWMQMKHFEKN